MRIVFFTDTYKPQINGVVRAVTDTEAILKKFGHEVFIVCPKVKGYKFPKNVFTCRAYDFKPYPEYKAAIPSRKLIKWIKEIEPDVIHVHTPATIGVFGLAIAKMLSIPVVATYHTLIDEYFKIYFISRNIKKIIITDLLISKLVKKFTKIFYNKFDLVIVPSLAIKKILLEAEVKVPIHVIPNGVDTRRFSPSRIKKSEKEINILWVGRLGKEKSLDVLLRAFKIVYKKFPNARLILIGDGPDRERLENIAKNLKISVEFFGYVNEEELKNSYREAYVFVSPSTTETQGLSVLEAMSSSCPVIVANSLAFKDFVKHGFNGLLFKPKNAKDLAKKITLIIENKSLRDKLAKNARKSALELSKEKQAENLLSIYKEISKKPLVSIVIPSLNEEKYIGRTLASIKNQSYKNCEVILVDGNSKDRTREIARRYGCKVIVEKRRGIGLARNIGANLAKGEILLFLDADTEIEKDFLEILVKRIKEKNVVCASGYIKAKGSFLERFIYRATSEIANFLSFIDYPHFYGNCLSCKKSAFIQVHGFNEALATCEDLDLTRKLAKIGKCIFLRDAIAYSSPRRIRKVGALKICVFHIINFFKYKLLKKPHEEYAIVR
ncbi:MAG: glycosyltransferase [Candidatus Aenigmatarchaeota archaeon]